MTSPTFDPIDPPDRPGSRYLRGALILAALVIGGWLDLMFQWVDYAFVFVAHQFYEVPELSRIRQPSQLALTRMHLAVGLGLAGFLTMLTAKSSRHARLWCAIFLVGYAIRALAWIVGGNVPLVPGDSSHYLEVATSIYRGEGPVKHYVESFFIDYPAIRQGKGTLDDWATPLYAYLLAWTYRLVGVVPGEAVQATVALAKGLSFVLNLLTLPALYLFARRRFGADVALGALAFLAVLPVHAIYAGFELRESLVGLTSVLGVWFLTEVWATDSGVRWLWAIAAGVAGGAAVLSRNTALALLAASCLYGLIFHPRRWIGPMLLWGVLVAAIIAPWAYATWSTYGSPFFTYTDYFQYTFSWTVHHYQKGTPKPADFYNAANAPEILRVKVKSLLIIAVTSTMIFGLPAIAAFLRRLKRGGDAPPPVRVDRLVATIALVFILATIARIADVTQVAQLGRYYMPLFVLMVPTAVAGFRDLFVEVSLPRKLAPWLAAGFVALLWADPTWAYDASWFGKPYQLHWPALQAAGDWAKQHPEQVPPDARIMTWFPWEFRLASQRTTVLMPRSMVLSNYQITRLTETINDYGVTHVLWGSFETSPNLDPETFGPELERLRQMVGFTDSKEIYRSPRDLGYPFAVRLYRLKGGRP